MHADDADRYFDYAATAPPFGEALSAQALGRIPVNPATTQTALAKTNRRKERRGTTK